MENKKKLGLYIVLGAALTIGLGVGAYIIAKKCEKCKNID